MIYVRTLGPPVLTVDGKPAPKDLLWRKNLALLVYLARSPKRRRSREHLVALLWGEKPESAARHSLNEALRVIRRHCGQELLMAEGDQVVLSVDGVKLDVDDLEALEHGGDVTKVERIVGGVFLEGFGVPDSNEFEDWMYAERRLWQRRSAEILISCADTCLDRGDLTSARSVARRAEAIDPLADMPIQVAMRCAALAGDRAAAVEIYVAFAARLERELGIEPEESTQELAERVRLQRQWRLPDSVPVDADLARRPPLVGREPELQKAIVALRRCAAESHAAAVIVRGDTGVGKSRVCQEIAARSNLDGFGVVEIRCVARDLNVPGSGLSGFLATPALRAERDDTSVAESDENAATFTACVRRAAETKPMLVWADSAEFLDADSVLALGASIRDLADLPVVVLLAAASQPVRQELDTLMSKVGRDLPGETITLEPLGQTELMSLARHALPEWDEDALTRLTRRLQRDSAGLPLIAVEILNAVRLGLELSDGDEVWPQPARTMDQTLPGPVPESLVAAIRIGFRRLSPEAQSILKVASLMEGRASAASLESATELVGDCLLEALDELEWQRWLAAEPRGYTFVALIHKDVIARDMMTEGQRKRILERLA